MASLASLLDRLEAAKRQFGMPDHARNLETLLGELGTRRFPDAASLIRFHEALLFFRAYPLNAGVASLCDELLGSMAASVEGVGDSEPFEEPDVSGISGTAFSAIFSYDITRWLSEKHPAEVEIDWEATDAPLLGPLLRMVHPYYAEDALVEANIPYMEWFRAGRKLAGRGPAPRVPSDLVWLMSRLDQMSIDRRILSDLFAAAKIAVRWSLGRGPTTRSNLRLAGRRKLFFHDSALLRRSDVSLDTELSAGPLPVKKLSLRDGVRFLDLARETSAMRYRELHGFTYGDPERVIHAQVGRGVEVFVCGVPREHRLPLRAYHAGMFFKNAVPIGYIECLTLFDRMEVGFNLYYTFREGETAWLYAKLLRLFRQLLGVDYFSVDPYQIGLHNDEAIESGAFWFYRKLGFRPVGADVARLLAGEEKKIKVNAQYRTSANVLKRLSASGMIYEAPGAQHGAYDRFDVHRLAMSLDCSPFPPAVQRAKKAPNESEYVRLLRGMRQTPLRPRT